MRAWSLVAWNTGNEAGRSFIGRFLAKPAPSLRFARYLILPVLLLLLPTRTFAYRPFDSTDANITNAGKVDLELGPMGYLREGSDRFLVAPAIALNFGIGSCREIVLEGRVREAWNAGPDIAPVSVVDTGASIQQLLREGSLQDKSGPSIAAEYGLLLPTVNGESGMGAILTGIVSQRWTSGTVHLNAAAMLNREHHRVLFGGLIGEARYSLPVRPAAEIFVQSEEGGPRILSALVGAIWRARENVAFDVGLRSARVGDENVKELRLGFTWGFPYRTGQ